MDWLKRKLMNVPITITRIFFFLSSYIPLYLLLIVANIDIEEGIFKGIINLFVQNVFWKTIYILIILPLLIFLFFLLKKPQSREKPNIYQSVEDNLISYIMTYITPLLTIDIANNLDDRTIIINILLFFIIGLLYVKQDLIYLNPTFLLLGFNIYKDSENDRYVITKLTINDLKEIKAEQKFLAVTHITNNLVVLKR